MDMDDEERISTLLQISICPRCTRLGTMRLTGTVNYSCPAQYLTKCDCGHESFELGSGIRVVEDYTPKSLAERLNCRGCVYNFGTLSFKKGNGAILVVSLVHYNSSFQLAVRTPDRMRLSFLVS